MPAHQVKETAKPWPSPIPKRPQETVLPRRAACRSRAPTSFSLRPEVRERDALAHELGINGPRKLSFEGQIAPLGKRGWRLSAHAGRDGRAALRRHARARRHADRRGDPAPLSYRPNRSASRKKAPRSRCPRTTRPSRWATSSRRVRRWPSRWPSPCPLYPRADGAELGEAVFAEDGAEPLSDEDVKPFAGLAALRDKLDGKNEARAGARVRGIVSSLCTKPSRTQHTPATNPLRWRKIPVFSRLHQDSGLCPTGPCDYEAGHVRSTGHVRHARFRTERLRHGRPTEQSFQIASQQPPRP